MTEPAHRRPDGSSRTPLVVVTARLRPEELAVLRALAERQREAGGLSVLLLNDAVYLVDGTAGAGDLPATRWWLLEEDVRGRGVRPTASLPVHTVGYPQVVELLFQSPKVVSLP